MATRKHKRADSANEGIRVKGMFRVHLEDVETGEIVGDSGWVNNQITMQGFQNYMAGAFGAQANSSQVNYVALGTGGAPATNATALSGELANSTGGLVRTTLTTSVSTVATTASAIFNGTFSSTGASSNNFISATQNISNIGLYATSTGSSLACGNTFASSAVATNQNVNITYTVSWH